MHFDNTISIGTILEIAATLAGGIAFILSALTRFNLMSFRISKLETNMTAMSMDLQAQINRLRDEVIRRRQQHDQPSRRNP